MKNIKQKYIVVLVLTILLVSTLFTDVSKAVNIYLDGQVIITEVEPEIRGNRTFVPLRVISENLGEDVGWNENTRTVSLVNGDREMKIVIGDTLIKVFTNSKLQKSFNIEAPPYIKQNRTMVPIRAISEFFGKEVDWDGETRSVYVGKKPDISGGEQNLASLKEKVSHIPRIKLWIPNYDSDVQIKSTDVGMSKIIKARLNEIFPGNYSVYELTDKNNVETGFSCFLLVDNDTGNVYYSHSGGIFTLPDNRIIHVMDLFKDLQNVHEDDQFVTGDGIIEVLRALAMGEGLVGPNDDLEAFAHLVEDHIVFDLWKANGDKMDYVTEYIIKDESIYKKDTN